MYPLWKVAGRHSQCHAPDTPKRSESRSSSSCRHAQESGLVSRPCDYCGAQMRGVKNYLMTRRLNQHCPARLQAIIAGHPDSVRSGYLDPSLSPPGDGEHLPSSRQGDAGHVGQIRRRVRHKSSPAKFQQIWEQATKQQSRCRSQRSQRPSGETTCEACPSPRRTTEGHSKKQLICLPFQSIHAKG